MPGCARGLSWSSGLRNDCEPFARRVWELRETVTVYDAWYVALAEWLDTEIVTADKRLTHARGPRCPIRLPQR